MNADADAELKYTTEPEISFKFNVNITKEFTRLTILYDCPSVFGNVFIYLLKNKNEIKYELILNWNFI